MEVVEHAEPQGPAGFCQSVFDQHTRKMRLYFLLCALFFAIDHVQSSGEMCMKYGGPCVPWQGCQPVLSLMARNDPQTVVLAFLCGRNNANYFVCCPNLQGGQGGQQVQNGGDDDDDIAPPKRWDESSDESQAMVQEGESLQQDSDEDNDINQDFEDYKRKKKGDPPKKKPIKGRLPKKGKKKPRIKNKRLLLPMGDCGVQATDKILGGKETLLEEFPWMALLHLGSGDGRGDFICGGSIISSRYVLTAAHCVSDEDFPPGFRIDKVRLGEHDQSSDLDCQGSHCNLPPQDIAIEKIIPHAQYAGKNGMHNDIALLRLRKPIKFNSFVQPICLPLDELESKNYDGEIMWNAGWGKTTNRRDSVSPLKLKVKLPVIPLSECQEIMGRAVGATPTQNMICAGAVKGKSSCHGDSGGPLMKQDNEGSVIRWHVHGVVSYGSEKCGREGVPTVYTRVGKYIKWILENMDE